MKKWGILLFLLVCLGISYVYIAPIFQEVEIQPYNQNNKGALDDEWSSESTQQKNINEDQINHGNLLLVNRDYPVEQESIKADIVNLFTHKELTQGYVLLESDIYLSEDVARKFSKMVDAAEKDGVSRFLISSGFRNFEEQRELYQDMGADYALPAGHSEHNLGLALDVGSTETSMYEASEGEWIKENAWKHGFILRYPEDKVAVTGIEYEPWHIRYVGLPHSLIMKEENFALEEYLDYLKDKRKVSVEVDGKNYTVSYYPFSENMKIDIPENHEYEISGNNTDGVIATVYE
ncbi:D-Ala-D-Ala carboxypeptidase. Metallo peptidase. MEROPS family M15B [Gracilibacillus orientalis]|uniref:D-Ala-D-Ala carboxypeptidase. Metallo peptidase. MEROPS family M15B n=1 Tax=Gracilibacillus orientalis TaxID=334253 RepID=A0A1I4Q8X1_9BACI|nr:VanY-A/VanY-F/VanY-M family D-Ala-D-Ala carboxypeptidase [Gracilibacillus orientalis]SFM36060.1 D-Ala-D-Ala carboxypeptidase. Metallo peptidase. MEROPS family M15B [Gracilibacillus orientalis]